MATTSYVNGNDFCISNGKYKVFIAQGAGILQVTVEDETVIVVEHNHLSVTCLPKDEVTTLDFMDNDYFVVLRTEDEKTKTQISEALKRLHALEKWTYDPVLPTVDPKMKNKKPVATLETSDPKTKKCIAISCIRKAALILSKAFESCPTQTSEVTRDFDVPHELQQNINKFGLSCDYQLPSLKFEC